MDQQIVKKYVSPQFIAALRSNCYNQDILRILAKEIPTMMVFEACAHREITSEEGAYIVQLQRESNLWIIRFLKDLYYTFFY